MESSVAGSTTERLREVADRWMEGWNAKDADVLVAQIADDLHYYDPAWPEIMRSADDVRAFTSAVWKAVPDMHFEETRGMFPNVDGTVACVPFHMTGTFTGRLDPPGFAPTGDRFELDGVDVFELGPDGRITRLDTHYDQMGLARKLGIMPAHGSRAEKISARVQNLTAKRRRR